MQKIHVVAFILLAVVLEVVYAGLVENASFGASGVIRGIANTRKR